MEKFHVMKHPLIEHKLTILRQTTTGTKDFREIVNEIARLLAYEVSRDLPLEDVEIETPIMKTTQMGQIGIRSVLKAPFQASLQTALRSQLKEYDSIEREAQSIAASRGWELEQLDPAIKGMTNMMTRMRLSFGNADSKAAAMMIQGNTRGVIKGLKNLHHCVPLDPSVDALAQQLVTREKENIRQACEYL